MLRSSQLRFVAIVLLAMAAASLIGASARAFSLGNGATGGANTGFADPDEQIGSMLGLDKGGEPSELGGPAQFDPRQSNAYKHFHIDSLTSPPDPLSRPSN
jgi:cytolysin (calcineurin-like family phosphatase)